MQAAVGTMTQLQPVRREAHRETSFRVRIVYRFLRRRHVKAASQGWSPTTSRTKWRVTLLTYIWRVPGSILVRETCNPAEVYLCFSSAPLANPKIVPWNMPRQECRKLSTSRIIWRYRMSTFHTASSVTDHPHQQVLSAYQNKCHFHLPIIRK